MSNCIAFIYIIVHIRSVFETPAEIAELLGARIRARRLALGWGQADAAIRAGVSYSTWRRMEAEGKASIDDLVRAAIALRCEVDLKTLFSETAATSMDMLLKRQQEAVRSAPKRRTRAPRRTV